MTSDSFSSLAILVPLAGIFGLLVGSFLNVAIYRVPLGLSVSGPRSFCPTSKRPHLVTWGWHGSIVSAGYCVLAASMITVSMIEFDGHRSPLSVAAIGTAIAQVIIVVGSSWHHEWRILGGSLAGSAAGLVAIGVLRLSDPECSDPRDYGRSCLLIAGCWIGGLGLGPLAVAAGVWIIVYFASMVGAWLTSRPASDRDGGVGRSTKDLHRVLGVPLVVALALAMVASLAAAS
jgi:prepilin signal peptidase PulO-like enzyme (type II secretory pathway)